MNHPKDHYLFGLGIPGYDLWGREGPAESIYEPEYFVAVPDLSGIKDHDTSTSR